MHFNEFLIRPKLEPWDTSLHFLCMIVSTHQNCIIEIQSKLKVVMLILLKSEILIEVPIKAILINSLIEWYISIVDC